MASDTTPAAVAAFVEKALAARADPGKAGPMAAYMKTGMPFYALNGLTWWNRAAEYAHGWS